MVFWDHWGPIYREFRDDAKCRVSKDIYFNTLNNRRMLPSLNAQACSPRNCVYFMTTLRLYLHGETKIANTRVSSRTDTWRLCNWENKGASTRGMISSFSLDDQLWMNICRRPHLFSFLHLAIHKINWNWEKINKLNGEGWCDFAYIIHHRLTRLTSSQSRMKGWLKLIVFTSTLHSAQGDQSSCGRILKLHVILLLLKLKSPISVGTRNMSMCFIKSSDSNNDKWFGKNC